MVETGLELDKEMIYGKIISTTCVANQSLQEELKSREVPCNSDMKKPDSGLT